MSDQLSAIELNGVEHSIRTSEAVRAKHVLLQTSAARRLYDMAQPNANDPRVTRLEAENDRLRDELAMRPSGGAQ